MRKPLTWIDWLSLILSAIVFAGNVNGGKPFVMPASAENVGYDLFSTVVWAWFLWSLISVARKMLPTKSQK